MTTRIAFFSFADIDNFGDTVFSHVFKMEIEKRLKDVLIDFYTPSNYNVGGIDYIAYNRNKIENNYDALIVFGGEVIHLFDERTWLPIYYKNGQLLESSLPSDVIFDWTTLEKPYKAWISVGVRPIENNVDYQKIADAVKHLDFISTRGNLSKKMLEILDLQWNNTKIEITPDIGWLFPSLLDYKNYRSTFYKNYIDAEKYLIFQINNVSTVEATMIANTLLDFQEQHKIQVILLPVIRPWEDVKYLHAINEASNNKFTLLPNNLNILEIMDILIHAHIVLTSSLHANITALSAGVPAGIINKWQGTKLQDIFGQQYRLHMVKHNLEDIPLLLDQLIKEREDAEALDILKIYSKYTQNILKIIFDNLTNNIEKRKIENG